MSAEIISLFDVWNDALQTLDPGKVADCYAEDGVLVPTLSNKVRTSRKEIINYFEHFLAKHPVGKIDLQTTRTYGDIAINSGIYTFALKDNGTVNHAQARFTFTYRKQKNGVWKIVEHHSSLMPEAIAA